MDKNDLLICIAEKAYDVGYSAKLHFATHDMVEKIPGLIGFLSLTVGVFGLYIDELSAKPLSAIFIVLGIVGLYINFHNSSKQEYVDAGVKLTAQFNDLKKLYYSVKTSQDSGLAQHGDKLSEIEREFNDSCLSKHLLFSDWLAHYKFFWQQQIGWIEEQKHFGFLRDKVPLSLSVAIVFVTILVLIYGFALFEKACVYFF